MKNPPKMTTFIRKKKFGKKIKQNNHNNVLN